MTKEQILGEELIKKMKETEEVGSILTSSIVMLLMN